MIWPHRKKRTFNIGIFQHIQLWKRSSPILNFKGQTWWPSTYQNLSLRPFHKWVQPFNPQLKSRNGCFVTSKTHLFPKYQKKTESSQSYPSRTLEHLKWRLNRLPTYLPRFFNHHPIRGVSRHLHVLCGVDSPRWHWHRKKNPKKKKKTRWIKWTYLGNIGKYHFS